MVGKWRNEPCSGVDEVVNNFWVLTEVMAKIHYNLHLWRTQKSNGAERVPETNT